MEMEGAFAHQLYPGVDANSGRVQGLHIVPPVSGNVQHLLATVQEVFNSVLGIAIVQQNTMTDDAIMQTIH